MKLLRSTGMCLPGILVVLTMLLFAGSGSVLASEILITGVIDGPLNRGTPKAIELYALDDVADLSIYGLGVANNGGGTDNQEYVFPSLALSAGEFVYISSETTGFENFFGFLPDFTSGSLNCNGDDAIELYRLDTVVDIFGDINVDGSGTSWEYTDGWAYRQSGTTFDGNSFNLSNWLFSGVDSLDGISDNASAVDPFPIGTFQSVPVPATLWLFVAGLVGLVGMRKKSIL